MLNGGKMQIIDDLKQVILGSVDVAVVVSAIQGARVSVKSVMRSIVFSFQSVVWLRIIAA